MDRIGAIKYTVLFVLALEVIILNLFLSVEINSIITFFLILFIFMFPWIVIYVLDRLGFYKKYYKNKKEEGF